MHQYQHSASPFITKVTLDNTLAYSAADLEQLLQQLEQGIAVYGFTPNIHLVVNASYSYWPSLDKLISAMLTGKLALVCAEHAQLSATIAHWQQLNPSIYIQHYLPSHASNARPWLNE
ncbi:hypothetical protein [Shewanella sp.]|uniref:hypothetical protein n=1 Tax=Shewanella sp. TaxID=50422 RepID=UPI003A96FBE5